MNYRPENHPDLPTDINRMEQVAGKVAKLIRERQYGSAEGALTIVELAARDARRQLRKLCRVPLKNK